MSGFDRQTPTGNEIYLDHVGWFIPDVNQASAAFERLGFILTPFVISRNADPSGGPPKPAGTGNRCAMLRRGYLELIVSIDGVNTPLAQQHRAAVARYTGLHVVALAVADPAAAYSRLKNRGFDPGEPVLLRRPLLREDGTETHAEFTVIRVPPEKMPEGRIQLLTQETPDLVWQDRLLARDNGIDALGGVLICADEPGRVAERYAQFTDRPASGRNDYYVVDLDRGRLGFATPRRCGSLIPGLGDVSQPLIPGVGMVSRDLDVTKEFFGRRRIPTREDGRGLRVSPGVALGATVVVHSVNEVWPPNP